jgi:hypothetical protein
LKKIDDPHAAAIALTIIVIGGTCLSVGLDHMGYGVRP